MKDQKTPTHNSNISGKENKKRQIKYQEKENSRISKILKEAEIQFQEAHSVDEGKSELS